MDTDLLISIGQIYTLKAGELLIKLREQHKLRALSEFVSRVFLHGMRLSTNGLKGHCSHNMKDSETRGLYELTGQQFDLPDIKSLKSLRFSLDNPDGVPWIIF
ncbi:hypothetical protein D3C75_773810 [compost metagenome]